MTPDPRVQEIREFHRHRGLTTTDCRTCFLLSALDARERRIEELDRPQPCPPEHRPPPPGYHSWHDKAVGLEELLGRLVEVVEQKIRSDISNRIQLHGEKDHVCLLCVVLTDARLALGARG